MNVDYLLIICKSEKLLQRIFNAAEMPKYAEKICDMRTLLKYAYMRQSHIRVFLTCLNYQYLSVSTQFHYLPYVKNVEFILNLTKPEVALRFCCKTRYRASASHGVPVYALAFTSTKLYCLVIAWHLGIEFVTTECQV